MGAKIFTFEVKIDDSFNYKIKDVAREIFNSTEFVEGDFLTNRSERIVNVTQNKYGFIFNNYDLAKEILMNKNQRTINRFYEYFNKPEFMFVWWSSSFDDSTGFSIIKNGLIFRSRYFQIGDDYVHSDNIGIPGDEEKKNLKKNSQSLNFDKEKGMNFGEIYPSNKIMHFYYTDNELLNNVMKKYLGHDLWNYPNQNASFLRVNLSKSIKDIQW